MSLADETSASDEAVRLCQRWIIEYDCWQMWSNFAISGTVEKTDLNRTTAAYVYCWRDNRYPRSARDSKAHGCSLLIHFMCKISSAAKEFSENIVKADCSATLQTCLEEAVDLLNYISHTFSREVEAEDLKELNLCLRHHAVLLPLYRGDTATAKAVFGRQWLHLKDDGEFKCREKLAAMLDDSEPPKQRQSYDEVMKVCQKLLEKIMSNMHIPFMIRAAELVSKKKRRNCDESDALDNSAFECLDSPKRPQMRRFASPNKPNGSPMKRDTCVAATTSKCDSSLVILSTASNTKATSTAPNDSDADLEIFSEDDMQNPSAESKRRSGGKSSGGRTAWSCREEEVIYRGVLTHGVGNWAMIHAEFLPDRTNVDIKDKWRTMRRQGQLKNLADKFGPLPVT